MLKRINHGLATEASLTPQNNNYAVKSRMKKMKKAKKGHPEAGKASSRST